MFSTDFIFRQPEMSGWIQAAMQQNTIVIILGLLLQLNSKWLGLYDASCHILFDGSFCIEKSAPFG